MCVWFPAALCDQLVGSRVPGQSLAYMCAVVVACAYSAFPPMAFDPRPAH